MIIFWYIKFFVQKSIYFHSLDRTELLIAPNAHIISKKKKKVHFRKDTCNRQPSIPANNRTVKT